MYRFRITDEPFARGYLECPLENKYIRTGKILLNLQGGESSLKVNRPMGNARGGIGYSLTILYLSA